MNARLLQGRVAYEFGLLGFPGTQLYGVGFNRFACVEVPKIRGR